MNQINILAFAGSARKESVNKKLVAIAALGAREAGASVTIIDLHDYPMPLFDHDLESTEGMPSNAKKIKQMMIDVDGFLIASPEYNSSISPLLKNVIDWASRAESKDEVAGRAYVNKVAALMAASPGALGGLRGLVHLRSILQNVGVMVLPAQRAVSGAYQAFNEQGNLIDEKQQQAIKSLGSALVKLATKLK